MGFARGFEARTENESFMRLLFSLQNFNVRVLTRGDVAFVEGILVDVDRDFITVVGEKVNYIPIDQISIIQRFFHHPQ